MLAPTAITKYHRFGGLNRRHLFLSSGNWKFKIKMPADSVFGEGPLPGLREGVGLRE